MNSTVEEIAIMMLPMSPICLAKPSTNPFSVVVFVSAAEFGEHLVERAAQVDGLRRIGDLHDVPADLALARGAVLVEVVVAEEHLRLVDGVATVVETDDVELPRGADAFRQPDRRGQRNAVAELPAETLGEIAADDGPLPVVAPGLNLRGRKR